MKKNSLAKLAILTTKTVLIALIVGLLIIIIVVFAFKYANPYNKPQTIVASPTPNRLIPHSTSNETSSFRESKYGGWKQITLRSSEPSNDRITIHFPSDSFSFFGGYGEVKVVHHSEQKGKSIDDLMTIFDLSEASNKQCFYSGEYENIRQSEVSKGIKYTNFVEIKNGNLIWRIAPLKDRPQFNSYISNYGVCEFYPELNAFFTRTHIGHVKIGLNSNDVEIFKLILERVEILPNSAQ